MPPYTARTAAGRSWPCGAVPAACACPRCWLTAASGARAAPAGGKKVPHWPGTRAFPHCAFPPAPVGHPGMCQGPLRPLPYGNARSGPLWGRGAVGLSGRMAGCSAVAGFFGAWPPVCGIKYSRVRVGYSMRTIPLPEHGVPAAVEGTPVNSDIPHRIQPKAPGAACIGVGEWRCHK